MANIKKLLESLDSIIDGKESDTDEPPILKPKTQNKFLGKPYKREKSANKIAEELQAQYEDFVKNKAVPDSKKKLTISNADGKCVVKNEKGVEVFSGSKTDCADYVAKKNKALNDNKKVNEGAKSPKFVLYRSPTDYKVYPSYKAAAAAHDKMYRDMGYKCASAEWFNDHVKTSNESAGVAKDPDTDQILYYLTNAIQSVKRKQSAYSNELYVEMVNIHNSLRRSLMKGNLDEFVDDYHYALEKQPDAATELYGEMFIDAGLSDQATIEEFLEKCATLNEDSMPPLPVKNMKSSKIAEMRKKITKLQKTIQEAKAAVQSKKSVIEAVAGDVNGKERYHFLYPHVPLNMHRDHEFNNLSDRELRDMRAHQRELAQKLQKPGAQELADIATYIQINRARDIYDSNVKGRRKKSVADVTENVDGNGVRATPGKVSVNLKQMPRWKVTQDNVKYYDHIMKNHGKVETLDVRPYLELLTDFNIMFTTNLPGRTGEVEEDSTQPPSGVPTTMPPVPAQPAKPAQPATTAPAPTQPGAAPANNAAAPAPGTPTPPQGSATNAATTPAEQVKALVQTLASNPAAAKQLGTKLNSFR